LKERVRETISRNGGGATGILLGFGATARQETLMERINPPRGKKGKKENQVRGIKGKRGDEIFVACVSNVGPNLLGPRRREEKL